MALYPSESEKINMKSIFQKITVQKVVKGFRYLKHYGWKEFIIRLQEKMEAENIPYEPWYEKHKATAEQIEKQKKQAEKWNDAPKISIVVPLFKTPETFLRAMIESVQAQTYGNWQLCLADGSGAGDEDADYMNTPGNMSAFPLNTMAHYDPAVIPLLDADVFTAYCRDEDGKLTLTEHFFDGADEESLPD